jgi:GDP-4-dehydro-6-deoxy-D-mannose reductase
VVLIVLVTGATGQVGRYLVDLMIAQGIRVVAMCRTLQPRIACRASVRYIEGDLLDSEKVQEALSSERFDVIFHLAGLNALFPASDVYRVNVLGTSVLLQAIRKTHSADVRFVTMSSSAVYGASADDPIRETSALAPVTNFGASKLCNEMMVRVAMQESGMPVMIARSFNIVGPGQRQPLLHSTVASQIAKIELGLQEPVVKLGQLDSYRDFVDVRDVVAGLAAMAKSGNASEAYNLCSGNAIQTRMLVDVLVSLSRVPVEVRSDMSRKGGLDVPRQRGSFEKFAELTGWNPIVSIETSLRDTLDYWRQVVRGEQNFAGSSEVFKLL